MGKALVRSARATKLLRKARNQWGMATAEYAVGTVAAVSFGGILLKVLTDKSLQDALIKIFLWLFEMITKLWVK